MKRAIRAALAAAAAVALSVFALGWQCGRTPQKTASDPVSRFRALDCELEIDSAKARDFAGILTSARLLNNRLVHDCQKLMKDRDHYGPLVAVLVADSVNQRLDRAHDGIVVADIFNYDNEEYPALHIKRNLNCLWLRGDTARRDEWKAAVTQDSTCVHPSVPAAQAFDLVVHAIPYQGRAPHPATVRWGWDRRTTQFVGIDCGNAWCEIGPPGFNFTREPRAGEEFGLADEQYLAIEDTAAKGTLKPSHVWGRIESRPILASPNSSAFAAPQHVASIILREDPDQGDQAEENRRAHEHYNTRYNLIGETTDLWMLFANQKDYYVGTSRSMQDSTLLTRCPWSHAVVGAVRWRWEATDEAAWLACTDGCCTTTHIGHGANIP